jgi:alpha-L-fucosidase
MITTLDCANWADKAILAFRDQTGCDFEDSLGDLLGDLMHWADARDFDFDAALDRARHHYAKERDEEKADRMSEPVRDLIDAFEEQTERARAVIDSWEQGDLAGAVHGLEMSVDESLAAIAKAKGGAA